MDEVLVAERDDALRGAIQSTLEASGWRVVARPTISTLDDALARRVRAAVVELADPEALATVERWTGRDAEVAIVGLLPDRDLERAVRAIKHGVREVLAKPFGAEALDEVLATVRAQGAASRGTCPILTVDPEMLALLREAERVAASEATVHIRGENGTGKDRLARWIHACSRRRDEAMVVVNCTALPQNLAESELFGHERGAFTGAVESRTGQIRSADRGTLVLDQIEELDPKIQPVLLRVLQEREVTPVGGGAARPVDVRVVSTSQRSLREEVARGRFREDLLYRLDVIALALPPLRDRPADIPLLAEHFLSRFAQRAGVDPPRLGAAARHALQRYAFPGNVRELENLMRRAVVWMPGEEIDVERLVKGRIQSADRSLETLNLRELERRAVARALCEFQGVRVRAAEALGISERTLRNKIRIYGLGR